MIYRSVKSLTLRVKSKAVVFAFAFVPIPLRPNIIMDLRLPSPGPPLLAPRVSQAEKEHFRCLLYKGRDNPRSTWSIAGDYG
jgi:hypothetical protein